MMSTEVTFDARILVVDDELANVRFLEVVLEQAGYKHVRSTTDSKQVLSIFEEWSPDLILLDLHMPHPDGFEVLELLRPHLERIYLPILILTADITPKAKRQALTEGAKDFLTKPLDRVEVLLRINILLQTRFQNQILESTVRERTEELTYSQHETLERLALAAEYRDDDTGLHTQRVGVMVARIAASMGVPKHQVALLEQTAPLHDIGKIGISDLILLKPGKLTEEEFEIMRQHTVIGGRILSGSRSAWLQQAEEIALSHHERWDGSGYPLGLGGEAIPLSGRIVAVADVFDALTNDRPYKKAWPVTEALAEIERQCGRHFDPDVVAAFLRVQG